MVCFAQFQTKHHVFEVRKSQSLLSNHQHNSARLTFVLTSYHYTEPVSKLAFLRSAGKKKVSIYIYSPYYLEKQNSSSTL